MFGIDLETSGSLGLRQGHGAFGRFGQDLAASRKSELRGKEAFRFDSARWGDNLLGRTVERSVPTVGLLAVRMGMRGSSLSLCQTISMIT